MAKDITRHIKPDIERELWARAAGRCQFDGCNRILYHSPLTKEQVNIAQKAHIYSFSEVGPRGWGHFVANKTALNDISNLLLACHACHKTIDQNPDKYPAELLLNWKEKHERRVVIVTGVNPQKSSHVVLYGENIGNQTSRLQPEAAKDALFPEWYPAEEKVIDLSMRWEGKDHHDQYWQIENENLKNGFNRKLKPLIDEGAHLSIFALAPIPLLMSFGALLTDKSQVQIYQLHREPKITWHWLEEPAGFEYIVKRPTAFDGTPILILSLSDTITSERITQAAGQKISIWELTIAEPHNDFLKGNGQLSLFRETMRKLIAEIGRNHGKSTPISIFPAIPLACALEVGRIRMPKADSEWNIYDYNNKRNTFTFALSLSHE